jgi:uncharacterized protein YqeY
MAALQDQLNLDLRDAMRTRDNLRRDELRGLLSQLQDARQTKLTRTLEGQGLILSSDSAEGLTSEQLAQIEQIRASNELSEDEAQAVLVARIVQHRQSIDAFRKGNRQDLLTTEEAQLAVLGTYLPQLDEAALEQAIQDAIAETGASGPRDQGKVMPLLSQRLRGKADMKAVAARVQALLTAAGRS